MGGVWPEDETTFTDCGRCILTSKDGSKTLSPSADDPRAIKLTERGGRVLLSMP